MTSLCDAATKWLMTAHGHATLALASLVWIGCNTSPPATSPSAPEPSKTKPPLAVPLDQAPILVAAASDLSPAFEELAQAFEAKTHQKVSFAFGSTGLLAKQVGEGAPFDLFAAANVSFVTELVKAGACDGATQAPYARGRIVIWTKEGLVRPAASLADLVDPRFRRIAIANPEHAPYGKAAKEALEKQGIWRAIERRIVYGENVRQALQFAQSGNAEAAIVAQSLVVGSSDGTMLLVDDALHAPIDQALVACNHGQNKAGATAFANFVNSAEGREVMRRYGFALPGETSSTAQ